jgi:hypothetical protein
MYSVPISAADVRTMMTRILRRTVRRWSSRHTRPKDCGKRKSEPLDVFVCNYNRFNEFRWSVVRRVSM